jgi:hypothetical protein
MRITIVSTIKPISKKPKRCTDFDSDCDLVPCKIICYTYDITKGSCPYLVSK